MKPLISIVIPTLNEENFIINTLDSIAAQSLQPAEIVIVDGNSTDRTQAVISDWIRNHPSLSTRLLTAKETGVSAQRNQGAAESTGEWIVFFDADVHLPPDFLKVFFEQLYRHHLQAGCPLYYTQSIQVYPRLFFGFFSWLFWGCQKMFPSGGGPCIAVKKSIFAQTSGFKHIKFEDLEFVHRLAQRARFGVIPTPIYISDRRMHKEGYLQMTLKYLLVSMFFLFGQLESRAAQSIEYQFGKYSPKNM